MTNEELLTRVAELEAENAALRNYSRYCKVLLLKAMIDAQSLPFTTQQIWQMTERELEHIREVGQKLPLTPADW